ncbi:MAG: S8 family serine peptidase [Candidatus Deferrimicrobiaceae bacterium]
MRRRRAIPWGARPPGVPTGSGVRIVVVDSGVNPLHSHVGGRIDGASFYRGKDGAVHRGTDYRDATGHGTAIAAVIRHVAPEADLFVLKIFNGALATTPDVLEGALAYALQAGARVVNLSLGMEAAESGTPLRALCRDAARAGILLVASARNGAKGASVPASYGEVIGVKGDGRLGEDTLMYRQGDPCECLASPWPRSLPGLPRERNFRGNSFAAARVSGAIACLLEESPDTDLDSLREMLRERYG